MAATSGAEAGGSCSEGADEELLHNWFQIYTGMQRITADLVEEVERSAGLTAPEFQVLWHLRVTAQRRAPMNELSRLLGFSTAGTTKLIDRLCAADLVQRRTSPADRRVILAELTAQGGAAAARSASILASRLRERFVGRLGEERVADLVSAFQLLGVQTSGGC